MHKYNRKYSCNFTTYIRYKNKMQHHYNTIISLCKHSMMTYSNNITKLQNL